MKKKILIPIIAGALVVIGVVIFLIVRSGSSSYFNIKIMDTTGTVKVNRDSSSLDAYEGMKIRDKDLLGVGQDGFTRIDCDRSTYCYFEHDTEASFIANSDKKLTINMIKGEMVVELQKTYSPDEDFSIATSNTSMAIRGTVVAVKVIPDADGNIRTLNYCLEGKADIEMADGSTETIEAGEGWLVVSDGQGGITESKAAGAEEFEFEGINIDTLKGADENDMILKDSNGNIIRKNAPATLSGNNVVIDENNFPDMIFMNYINNKIDKDRNGLLSQDELGETSIRVESLGISDLKGIEFFKDLEFLNCDSNHLKYLDLSGNTKIRNLYCAKNMLDSLNIGNCSELSHLSCNNNNLEVLDVSKCSKLQNINCEHNNIKTLDLRNAGDIDTLVCGNNMLLDLDLTNNTKLIYLDCNMNPLTNLDVSQNKDLVYLYCHYAQLFKLDVSSNTKLQCLYLGSNPIRNVDITNNTELIEFSCFNTMISELDVSHNTKLTLLLCGYNAAGFKTLDVSKNTELKELQFPNNRISEIDLSHNPKLEKLDCMYCELTKLDISHNPLLTEDNMRYDKGKVEIIR